MKAEDKIIKKYGRNTGFRVPDEYFESFYKEMAGKLPEYPEKPHVERLTMWQRVRPYVYMAAMFAGIWLMMKVFVNVSDSSKLNIDNPPQEIVLAMANYDGEFEEISSDNTSEDIDLMEEVGSEYSNIDDFESDFDYKLDPKYANINVNAMIDKAERI